MVKEINLKKLWDDFFNNNGSASFLQSWEWGELQKSSNHKILRLGVYSNKILKVIVQIIKIKSRRGNFLFIPHGPIFAQIKNAMPAGRQEKLKIKNYIEKIKTYLVEIAKTEDFSFIRIAPVLEDRREYREIFQNLGFKKAPIYMHAERVWVLPLDKTEEELLAKMRKTTRYLVKRAQRENVIIEKRYDNKAIDDFWQIYKETARRENFIPFSKKFIADEFMAFSKTGNAIFLFAEVNKKYLAAGLIIFTKSTAFYHQGASIHSKIPTNYALQWEAIKEAKKQGCKFYNFWGILKKGRTPANWSGLTLFKQGFGGMQIDYLPTQDFILSPKYYLIWLYENFLNLKRGVY